MIKRIIARLDIKNNFLVKGMNLEGLRILGYPELFSKKYFDEGIDEIIFQDVVASLYKRNQLSHLTSKISENVFVPITVGGGIRSIKDIKEILVSGADRVSINTGAIHNKKFVEEAIKIFGTSTICISIETLKIDDTYKIYTDSGRTEVNKDTFDWIKEVQDMGVGEIILTSINNEGAGKGFDINLYEKASNKTTRFLDLLPTGMPSLTNNPKPIPPAHFVVSDVVFILFCSARPIIFLFISTCFS